LRKRILSLLLAAILLLGTTTVALAENEQAPQGLSLRLCENGKFTGPYLTKLTHGYSTTKTYGVFLDGVQQTEFTVEESEFYTAVIQDGLVTLTINSMDSGWKIWFQLGETNRQFVEFRYEENTQTYPFAYNGTDYTLVFGPERGTNPVHVADSWFGMDTNAPGQGLIAAVFQNYGDKTAQKPAPDEIQKLITNVTLTVTDDDNGCMAVEPAKQQTAGWWQGKALVSENKVAGDGYITADITVNGKPVTLKVVGRVFAAETLDKTHTASGSPAENMMSLQTMLDNMNLQGKSATLTLTPGAIYEGTLKVKSSGLNGLTIKGGVDKHGNPTVIRGELQLHSAITAIEDLCFAAPSKNGPTFGVDHRQPNAAAWWIRNCAFLGYTVAVNCTYNGYTLPTHNNLFVNNETAVRFECGPTNMAEPNCQMTNSVFLHNDVAVEIVSLPDTVARHEFRIRDCDFLNNGKDFVTPENQKYPYYFHENYFGDTTGNGKVKARGAKLTGNVAHEICQLNPVSFRWSAETCWWQGVKLNNGFLFHSQKPAVASEEETQPNVLVETLDALDYRLEIIQGGGLTILETSEQTALLNEETTRLSLGAEALDGVAISVNDFVDGQETTLGTWTFE